MFSKIAISAAVVAYTNAVAVESIDSESNWAQTTAQFSDSESEIFAEKKRCKITWMNQCQRKGKKSLLLAEEESAASNAEFGDLSFLESEEQFKEAQEARKKFVAEHVKLVEARKHHSMAYFSAKKQAAILAKIRAEFAADLKKKMAEHEAAKALHVEAAAKHEDAKAHSAKKAAELAHAKGEHEVAKGNKADAQKALDQANQRLETARHIRINDHDLHEIEMALAAMHAAQDHFGRMSDIEQEKHNAHEEAKKAHHDAKAEEAHAHEERKAAHAAEKHAAKAHTTAHAAHANAVAEHKAGVAAMTASKAKAVAAHKAVVAHFAANAAHQL